MKTIAFLISLLGFLTSLFAGKELAGTNSLVQAKRLNSLEAYRKYTAEVTLLESQANEIEEGLKSAEHELQAALLSPTNCLRATLSIITNFSRLESNVNQSSNLCNVIIDLALGMGLPNTSPELVKDQRERDLLIALTDARRSYRKIKGVHGRLSYLQMLHSDLASKSLVQICFTNQGSNEVRELIFNSATNEFARALSNRLYQMK